MERFDPFQPRSFQPDLPQIGAVLAWIYSKNDVCGRRAVRVLMKNDLRMSEQPF